MQSQPPRSKSRQNPIASAILLGVLLTILLPFIGLGAGIAVRLFLLASGL